MPCGKALWQSVCVCVGNPLEMCTREDVSRCLAALLLLYRKRQIYIRIILNLGEGAWVWL